MTTISKGTAAAIYLAQNECEVTCFLLFVSICARSPQKWCNSCRKVNSFYPQPNLRHAASTFFAHLSNFGLEAQPCGRIAFVLLFLFFFIDVHDLSIFNCNEMLDMCDNFCTPTPQTSLLKLAVLLRFHNLVHRQTALGYPL